MPNLPLPAGHIHPSIKNDGYSTLMAWVKIVGVHPVPTAPSVPKSRRSRPNGVDFGFASAAGDGSGSAHDAEHAKVKALRTKVRTFRFGGYREVTSIVARKSCIVAATLRGSIDVFDWPCTMSVEEAYRSRLRAFDLNTVSSVSILYLARLSYVRRCADDLRCLLTLSNAKGYCNGVFYERCGG